MHHLGHCSFHQRHENLTSMEIILPLLLQLRQQVMMRLLHKLLQTKMKRWPWWTITLIVMGVVQIMCTEWMPMRHFRFSPHQLVMIFQRICKVKKSKSMHHTDHSRATRLTCHVMVDCLNCLHGPKITVQLRMLNLMARWSLLYLRYLVATSLMKWLRQSWWMRCVRHSIVAPMKR